VMIGDDVWLAALPHVRRGRDRGSGRDRRQRRRREIPEGALAEACRRACWSGGGPRGGAETRLAPARLRLSRLRTLGLLVADFTVQSWSAASARTTASAPVEATVAPFGQVVQTLHALADGAHPGLDSPDLTRPRRSRAGRMLNEPAATTDIMAEGRVRGLVRRAAAGVRSVFVSPDPARLRARPGMPTWSDGLASTVARDEPAAGRCPRGRRPTCTSSPPSGGSRPQEATPPASSRGIGKAPLAAGVRGGGADIRATPAGLRGQARRLVVPTSTTRRGAASSARWDGRR
jgi:hypothetical protein